MSYYINYKVGDWIKLDDEFLQVVSICDGAPRFAVRKLNENKHREVAAYIVYTRSELWEPKRDEMVTIITPEELGRVAKIGIIQEATNPKDNKYAIMEDLKVADGLAWNFPASATLKYYNINELEPYIEKEKDMGYKNSTSEINSNGQIRDVVHKKWIDSERENMDELSFRQELECNFVSENSPEPSQFNSLAERRESFQGRHEPGPLTLKKLNEAIKNIDKYEKGDIVELKSIGDGYTKLENNVVAIVTMSGRGTLGDHPAAEYEGMTCSSVWFTDKDVVTHRKPIKTILEGKPGKSIKVNMDNYGELQAKYVDGGLENPVHTIAEAQAAQKSIIEALRIPKEYLGEAFRDHDHNGSDGSIPITDISDETCLRNMKILVKASPEEKNKAKFDAIDEHRMRAEIKKLEEKITAKNRSESRWDKQLGRRVHPDEDMENLRQRRDDEETAYHTQTTGLQGLIDAAEEPEENEHGKFMKELIEKNRRNFWNRRIGI